jgi:hypothetical protein
MFRLALSRPRARQKRGRRDERGQVQALGTKMLAQDLIRLVEKCLRHALRDGIITVCQEREVSRLS